jgi:NAD(P)H-dependent FMN reductase
MREFDAPSYDADAQSDRGFPGGAEMLRDRLERSDAFVVSSPEYNLPCRACSIWMSNNEDLVSGERA